MLMQCPPPADLDSDFVHSVSERAASIFVCPRLGLLDFEVEIAPLSARRVSKQLLQKGQARDSGNNLSEQFLDALPDTLSGVI